MRALRRGLGHRDKANGAMDCASVAPVLGRQAHCPWGPLVLVPVWWKALPKQGSVARRKAEGDGGVSNLEATSRCFLMKRLPF